MKKLVLRPRDGTNVSSFLIVDDEQLPTIEKGMQHPIGFWCSHKGSKDAEFIGRGEIVRITAAGRDAPEIIDHSHRIAMPEITDEQRAANIEKFTKMKQDWLKKRELRKAEAEQAKQKASKAQSAKEAAARQKAQDDLHNFVVQQKKDGKIKEQQ